MKDGAQSSSRVLLSSHYVYCTIAVPFCVRDFCIVHVVYFFCGTIMCVFDMEPSDKQTFKLSRHMNIYVINDKGDLSGTRNWENYRFPSVFGASILFGD